jgi:hypothetical protein
MLGKCRGAERQESKNTGMCATRGHVKSAIAEHQWDQQHQLDWDETRVLDRATRLIQLKIKEALHIEKTPLIAGLIGRGV